MMVHDSRRQSEILRLPQDMFLEKRKPHYSSHAALYRVREEEVAVIPHGCYCRHERNSHHNELHPSESLAAFPSQHNSSQHTSRLHRLHHSESLAAFPSPAKTPSPKGDRHQKPLERRRGPWRDAGFWLRIISPGGTKQLLKKLNNNNIGDKNSSPKSATLPRNARCLAESPPRDMPDGRGSSGSSSFRSVKTPKTPKTSRGSGTSSRSPLTPLLRLKNKSAKSSFFHVSPRNSAGSPEESLRSPETQMCSLNHPCGEIISPSVYCMEVPSQPTPHLMVDRMLPASPVDRRRRMSPLREGLPSPPESPAGREDVPTTPLTSRRNSGWSNITLRKSSNQCPEEDDSDWLNSAGIWDGSPRSSSLTPTDGHDRSSRWSPLRSFERLTPRSRTLPRDLKCGSPCGSVSGFLRFTPRGMSRSKSPTGGSPWWWRVLSPSTIARKILLSEKRQSPLSPPDIIIEWVEGGSEKKWARTNSLRRPFNLSRENNSGRVHHQDPAAHSDTELGKISASHSLLDGECGSVGGGSVTSERGIDVGRVASWATSFEKLLEDPAGLHTFAEFLKKEYSHENIYFWTACERYKRLSSPDELQAMAKVISERHLCIGASEPVNVDSQARQDAQDSLHNPNEFLFSQAQKQIFNLMKFDSYSRFLKSSLYQDCLSRDMRGQTLPYPGDDTLDPDLKIIQDDSHVTLKKSKSDADERRRKSLLPWHRKDRSKSKDRGEAEYRRQKKMGHRNQSDSSSVRSDMSGSRTSLNSSSDLAMGRRAISKESLTSGELGSLSGSEGYNRCRVILPDLSNSVVAVRHGDTIQELLTRLLERRGISYSTFDVYQNKSDKLMDKNEDSTALGGLEVRIERRILFRLDLPNRKTVCVKAKPNKLTSEVLKPILHKYGYKLDLMSIHKVGEEKGVNLKCHVNEIDGDRLVVQTKEEVKEWGVEPARQKKRGNSLDEITNRVFEDLLKGKSQQNFDELGILDFDARSSRTEHSSSDRSSGITGGFSLRNSLAPEKDIMSGSKVRKPANRSSVHDSLGVRGMMPPPDHALITKRRGNSSNPPNAKQENDELYEGLKRAQRSRLDDQRGTEINFELPDFLKCDQPLEDKENQHGAHLADQLLAHLECSFSEGGVIPSHQEAEDYFSMAHPEVWGGIPATSGPNSPNATLMAPDLDLDDFDDTLVADDSPSQVPMPDASNTSLHVDPPDFSPPPPICVENSVPALSRMIPPSLQLSPPPPLPPKPKLGGTRGPPPRPPSRQLHLLNPPTFSSSTSDDDTLHPSDHPPIHAGRQQGHHDKFNISFV